MGSIFDGGHRPVSAPGSGPNWLWGSVGIDYSWVDWTRVERFFWDRLADAYAAARAGDWGGDPGQAFSRAGLVIEALELLWGGPLHESGLAKLTDRLAGLVGVPTTPTADPLDWGIGFVVKTILESIAELQQPDGWWRSPAAGLDGLYTSAFVLLYRKYGYYPDAGNLAAVLDLWEELYDPSGSDPMGSLASTQANQGNTGLWEYCARAWFLSPPKTSSMWGGFHSAIQMWRCLRDQPGVPWPPPWRASVGFMFGYSSTTEHSCLFDLSSWPHQDWTRSPYQFFRAIAAVHALDWPINGSTWAAAQIAAAAFTQRLRVPPEYGFTVLGAGARSTDLFPDDVLRVKGASFTCPACVCSAEWEGCSIPDVSDCGTADDPNYYRDISRVGPSQPVPGVTWGFSGDVPVRRWVTGVKEDNPIRPETVLSCGALWGLARLGTFSGYPAPGGLAVEPLGGTVGTVLARQYLKGLASAYIDDGTYGFWVNKLPPGITAFADIGGDPREEADIIVTSYAALLTLFEAQRAMSGLFGGEHPGIPSTVETFDGEQMTPDVDYAQDKTGLLQYLASGWGPVKSWPPFPNPGAKKSTKLSKL